jgi:hypothetical protein
MDDDLRNAIGPATRCATGIMPVAVSLSLVAHGDTPGIACPPLRLARIPGGRMAMFWKGICAIDGGDRMGGFVNEDVRHPAVLGADGIDPGHPHPRDG